MIHHGVCSGAFFFLIELGLFRSAIDVWSVGVILLTILTGTYPFFHSPDDMTALAELTCLFGKRRMRDCASIMGRP